MEGKHVPQGFDSFVLHDFQLRDLGMKLGDLGLGHGRCVAAARDAPHLSQCLHLPIFLEAAATRARASTWRRLLPF